ncbi:MAG: hypothetical protein Q8R13_00925 [bacterium]|nr:hypothetical protein [bacterium]MDZ4295776.1 hypothetical protein [Patescibacteria group bacterium]
MGLGWKLLWLQGWLVAGALWTIFALSRLDAVAIGAELGTALEAALGRSRNRSFFGDAAAGAGNYVQFVGALLASELVVGQIAFWLPTHKSPALALLMIVSGMTLVAHAVWQASTARWPRIVSGVSWFTFAAAAFGLLFSRTVLIVTQDKTLDDALTELILSKASPWTVIWAAALVLIGSMILATMVTHPALKKGLTFGMPLIVTMLVVQWLVAGEGAAPVREYFSRPRPEQKPITVTLEGVNQWVRIDHLVPPCTDYMFDAGKAPNARVRFGDGGVQSLEPHRPFGVRKIQELDGQGTVLIWLSNVGKRCS